MNENLDLTKILKGCPKGTEFYHAGYGAVVKFIDIDSNSDYPIQLALHNNSIYNYANLAVTEKGTISANYEGECLLFPSKDQRDWSKFVRFWDKSKKKNLNVERFDPTTFKPFDKVLVKDYKNDIWTAGWYSHSANNLDDGWHVCDNSYWHYVIPYTDDTKHLIGTNEDCPEYYKWWEEQLWKQPSNESFI